MCNQEDSEHKGGILADEMGMGKTIQAIALICTHKPPLLPEVPPPQVPNTPSLSPP